MKLTIILVTIAIIQINAEPPVGKDHQNHQNQIDGYQSGPPPQGWNQLSNYGPPQDSYQQQHKQQQPTKIRNSGNSNIFGWLGSRFAKIPSLLPRLPAFPKFTFNQHQKPQYQALIQNGDYGNKPEKVKIYNQPIEQNYGQPQQHQQQYSAPQQQQQYSAPAGPQLEVFPSTMIAYSQMSQSGPSQSSYIQPSYAAPTLAPASLKPAKIPNGPVPYVPVSTGPDYFDTAYYQQQMREQQKLQQQYSSPAHIYQQPQQQSYHIKQTYQRPQPQQQHQQSHYQKPQIQSYQAPQQSYQQPQQQYQNPIVNLAEYSNNYDAPLTAFSTIPDIGTQEISNNYADYTNQNIQSHSFGQNQIHQQSHGIPQPGDSYSAPSAPEASIKAQGSNSYSTHLSPGVKLLSQSSQEGTGNPVFEIITDADAPSFDGHPFDLKKLIAMIEPGAEIESLPQLSELASESKSTYTQVAAPPGISSQNDKSDPDLNLDSNISNNYTTSSNLNTFQNPLKNGEPSLNKNLTLTSPTTTILDTDRLITPTQYNNINIYNYDTKPVKKLSSVFKSKFSKVLTTLRPIQVYFSAQHNSSARPELTSTTTTQNPNHNYDYLPPYMYSPPSTSSPVQNTKSSSSSSEINPYLDEILELVDDDEYSDKPSLILESQGDLSAAESQENGELQGSESQVHSYRIKITPPPNFFTTSKPTVKYFNPKSPKPMVSPPSLVRNNKSVKNPEEIVKVDLETLKNTNITTSSSSSESNSSSSSTTKRPSPVFKGKTVDSH